MLRAGYLEDWEWNATLSGAAQGGVASRVLSNIYLDRLDQFAEKVLIPEYTRGRLRRRNPSYHMVENEINRIRKRNAYRKEHTESDDVRELRKQLRRLPAGDPQDPGYRRRRYIRDADDHPPGSTRPRPPPPPPTPPPPPLLPAAPPPPLYPT